MPMIKSIELVNWRSHKHNVLNFQKGVNVLIGIMGAGKSSVMDAISFGLFGTFPALAHRRTSLDGLILNKPGQEDEAEVKIEFVVGDDTYKVTRKITRESGTTARLERNGEYMQAQPERVNEEVERLLSVDYDTFSRVVYSEQNRLDYFLELAKGDRKRQMDQMLGLDRFANAELNATSLINSIKSIIGSEEQMLAQIDADEFKRQMESLAREKIGMENEQKALEGEAEAVKTGMEKRGKELAELKLRYEKRMRLSKEIAEMESRMSTLSREIERISLPYAEDRLERESKERKDREKALNAELKALKDKKDLSTKALAEAESELKSCLAKIKERDRILESVKGKDLAALGKELKDSDTEMQELMKDLASLRGKRQELSELVKELGKHTSKCPICERVMDDEMRRRLLDEKNALSKGVEEGIEKTSKKSEDMRGRIERVTKEHNAVLLANKRLEDYKDVDKLAEKARDRAESERKVLGSRSEDVEKIEKELSEVRNALKELDISLEAAKRKKNYESEVKKSSELLISKKSELANTNVDEKALYGLQETIAKENARMGNLTSKIEGNKKYLANMESQMFDKAKQIANFNQMKDKVERRRKQISVMNKFKSALVDTEGLLRNRLVTSINSMVQSVWSEIYPYADYSGVRLEASKDDYMLEAGVASGSAIAWAEVDGMASGGERSMACLAMRIALAMVVVPNLKWLILDEPTHNIDENGIAKFVDMLGNTLPKVVEQVFVITHDSELKQVNAARVYQLERDKDSNGHTKVVEL
jgi:exonuclease SbcC